jgi:hypothetical protein
LPVVAFNGATATGFRRHRRDQRSREQSGVVFVDGCQLVGALPVADQLAGIDVLAPPITSS